MIFCCLLFFLFFFNKVGSKKLKVSVEVVQAS